MAKPNAAHTNRNPIRVARLSFVDGRQDGPGFSVASSLTASSQENRHQHLIEFYPWLRAFRVEYRAPGKDASVVEFIPEHRVMRWAEADD